MIGTILLVAALAAPAPETPVIQTTRGVCGSFAMCPDGTTGPLTCYANVPNAATIRCSMDLPQKTLFFRRTKPNLYATDDFYGEHMIFTFRLIPAVSNKAASTFVGEETWQRMIRLVGFNHVFSVMIIQAMEKETGVDFRHVMIWAVK